MSQQTLTITDNRTGKSYTLPIEDGTVRAMELRQIKADSDDFGLMTYDPALMNTAATKSAITFLDGDKGILRYRGYAIEELAEKSSFIEVAYLLIYGNLPSKQQLDQFQHEINTHTLVHEDTKKILDGFPSTAHPMGVVASLFCSQTAFYPESLDPNRPNEKVNLSIIRCLAKMPTFAAWAHKNAMGHPVNYPDNSLAAKFKTVAQ